MLYDMEVYRTTVSTEKLLWGLMLDVRLIRPDVLWGPAGWRAAPLVKHTVLYGEEQMCGRMAGIGCFCCRMLGMFGEMFGAIFGGCLRRFRWFFNAVLEVI